MLSALIVFLFLCVVMFLFMSKIRSFLEATLIDQCKQRNIDYWSNNTTWDLQLESIHFSKKSKECGISCIRYPFLLSLSPGNLKLKLKQPNIRNDKS